MCLERANVMLSFFLIAHHQQDQHLRLPKVLKQRKKTKIEKV